MPTLIVAELAAAEPTELFWAHADGPVVREEHDKSVLCQVEFMECVEDLADTSVQFLQHPPVLVAVLVVDPIGILALGAMVRRILRGLVGVMHRRVRDVEEERIVLVAFDKLDAAVGNDVCRIAGHILFFETNTPGPVLVVVRRAVEEADEFVEAMVDRVVLVLIAAVPFAEKRCRVAVVLENSRESWDRGRYPALRFPATNDHVNNADALLVPAGEERGTGRATDRGISVKVGEYHPLVGHLFDARCLDPTVVQGHIAATQVVGQDDHDVGRAVGVRHIWRRNTPETIQQAEKCAQHKKE